MYHETVCSHVSLIQILLLKVATHASSCAVTIQEGGNL